MPYPALLEAGNESGLAGAGGRRASHANPALCVWHSGTGIVRAMAINLYWKPG